MKVLNKLERKYGDIYIPNLMALIIAGNIMVYVLNYAIPDIRIIDILYLNKELVLRGEIWRLITFIFVPSLTSPFWFIIGMYFSYMVGTSLERLWGEFKFNIYYFIGILTTIVISFITGTDFLTGEGINMSLFLAFARIFPNYELLIFYIIPVKVKYFAIFYWIILIIKLIGSGSLITALIILLPVINFLIFFGKEVFEEFVFKKKVVGRRKKFEKSSRVVENEHKCFICGITEKDDKEMEFRYCSKCKGRKCYCENHIRNHEHN
ncbi:rhomboid family intramembrane serine protease [Clostridium sp.]|uniref:rhomboid family intramembrane serine protease n=1 Tax=Clostridium sp. TaxID=1506 RepID=UPI002625C1D0|nr:rhomboid family intramembrane serine protease [Clostridium sp.]